jgi:hypothetical protein
LTTGERGLERIDWSAGIPACNVAASAASNVETLKPFRVEATLMQAGMPALQSRASLPVIHSSGFDIQNQSATPCVSSIDLIFETSCLEQSQFF